MKLTASQLRRLIKEEVEAMMPASGGHDHEEFLHGHESGHPGDDEGDMIKTRMASMQKMAGEVEGMLDSDDQLPAWVQDLLATSHNDLRHVHDYLTGVKGSAGKTMGESRRRKVKSLNEGHARITDAEFAAWKRGDWGFVSEDAESYKDMTRAEAEAFIASKDPNETATDDVVDVDTGEIYVSAGETFGSSHLHPEKVVKPGSLRLSLGFDDDDMEEEMAEEDYETTFKAALDEFVSDYGPDSGLSVEDAEGAAFDLADNFFYKYPQWKQWSALLDMSKSEMKSAVAEAVYEAMSK